MGTDTPSVALEVSAPSGASQILVDDQSTAVKQRRLMRLETRGQPQIRLVNKDSGARWDHGLGEGDSHILKSSIYEFRYTRKGRVRWFKGKNANFDYRSSGNLTIAGTLTENSDRNAKRDIVAVDGARVLEQVAALPVATWTYREDEDGARHLGPMAQDFHAAFGLGADDTHVSPRDVAGVALAAVKELQAVVQQKDEEIAALEARLAALEVLVGGATPKSGPASAQ